MIWQMAYRNMWRNSRRTLITILSIGGGMMFGLLFTGIQDGSYKIFINSAARLASGHLTIEHRAYRESQDIRDSIVNVRAIEKSLAGIASLQTQSLRINGQGMLASSHGASGITFDAVMPSRDGELTPIVDYIVKGRYLDSAQLNGIVLGYRLAKKLKVSLGSKLVLTAQNRERQTVQELVRVRGIFQTGSEATDAFYCQMNLAMAQKLYGYAEDEVLQVTLYLDTFRSIPAVRRAIAERFDLERAGLALLSWEDILFDLANYVAMDHAWNYVLQLLAFLIVAAGILNTVLMSVLERQREFGVLLAVGMLPCRIFFLVCAEALLLGLFGIALGSVLGWSANTYLQYYPIDLTSFMSGDISISGFAFEPVLRCGLYFDHYLMTSALVYLLVVVVGMYPAWRAARVHPVDALHEV